MKILNGIILTAMMLLVPSHVLAQQPSMPQQQTDQMEKELIRFDLDFPGGTPLELVAAIQKATGRALNAVVADRYAEQKLPAIKVKGVTAPKLFTAMLNASTGQTKVNGGYSFNNIQFGFRTDGPYTNDSVWFFFSAQTLEQEICRFYLLKPYLQTGLSVDDITTAIQTSWKMLGTVKPPKLSFHKETSLLIAVGLVEDVSTIDDVLKALNPQSKASGQERAPMGNETDAGKR